MEGNRSTGPQVLMLPWLALGHAIPFLELAKRLCDRGFTVHICSTQNILSAIQNRLQRDAYGKKIHTLEIHLPPIPGLPPRYRSTSSLPPHLMPLLKDAFQAWKPEVTSILQTVKPDFLIHDYIPGWLPALADELAVRDILFITLSAACYSFFTTLMAGCTAEDLANSPLGSLKLHEFETERMDRFLKENTREKEQVEESYEFAEKRAGGRIIAFKTKRFLEERFIDYVEALTKRKVVTVGTLVAETDARGFPEKEFTDWLETKERSSVVFVSFGSECFMSNEEIAEIAFGLELSEQNFIWVIRLLEEEEEGKIESVLPEGFSERVRQGGLVVNGWAPQTTILSHPSTGSFLTHCGWGSVCEAMARGVPFVALPLKIGQPWNAKLIVVELGLGMEIERERNGDFKREKVGEAIKRVMVQGEESEGMRRKAKEMAERIREDDEREMDELVAELQLLLPPRERERERERERCIYRTL